MNQGRKLSDEQVSKPAKIEYLINFAGGIFGDYNPGQVHHNYILLGTMATPDEVLMDLNMPKNRLNEYNFKIKVDETLEVGVKRLLKDEFGLNLFHYKYRILNENALTKVMIRAVCQFTPLQDKMIIELLIGK